jgi:uncharacterized protein YutE (UPF0331/DUF86 family)
MPDIEIIEKHISSYLTDVDNLKKHLGITLSDVNSDKDLLWVLERGIYLLIQNLFDMLAHIVSADFKVSWDSYTDIAEILAVKKVISEEDKTLLQQMAGFRNRLSHEYLSLDARVLVDIINNRLNDFDKFLFIIKHYCGI